MLIEYFKNFLVKNFSQVKTGGFQVLALKMIKLPLVPIKFFEVVISIFLLILLKFMKYFLLIRFGIYRCDKIGETIAIEIYLAEKKKEKRFTIDFFIKKKRFVINIYLIFKKKISIYCQILYLKHFIIF